MTGPTKRKVTKDKKSLYDLPESIRPWITPRKEPKTSTLEYFWSIGAILFMLFGIYRIWAGYISYFS